VGFGVYGEKAFAADHVLDDVDGCSGCGALAGIASAVFLAFFDEEIPARGQPTGAKLAEGPGENLVVLLGLAPGYLPPDAGVLVVLG